MGMFDRLTCLYKLPLPEEPKGFTGCTEFQTKNFENILAEYKIDEQGKLWKCKKAYNFDKDNNFKTNSTEWVSYDITDTIEISNYYIHDEEKEYDYWITYELVIIKGEVDSAKILKFEAVSNKDRKDVVIDLIKSFEKRDKFENTFLYKHIYRHYNNTINSFFKSFRELLGFISKISWKIESKIRI